MAFLQSLRALRHRLTRSGSLRVPSGLLSLSAALALAVLTACGGGGGSNGGGGTPDPGFSISPSSLSFTAHQGDPAPPAKSIQITITSPDAVYVGAGWVGAPPSWATSTAFTGSGRDWSLGLQAIDTTLAPGTYTATLRIGIAKSDQTIIGTRDAVLTYQVFGSFSVVPSALTFSYVQGQPAPAGQSLSISGTGGAWTASADQSWISLATTSGSTPGSLGVSVNPAGLSVGDHTGNVSFRMSADGSVTVVPVTVSVAAPGYQTDSAVLSFSGIHGSTLPAQPLGISMNTGEAVAWTATVDNPWIILGKSSGATPDSLNVSVNPAIGPAAGGTYHSKIHLNGTYGGVAITKAVDVDLTLSAAALTLNTTSLSYSGINGDDLGSTLLQVGMNNGRALAWTATPSAPWIVLSKGGGNTPDQVQVSPDPSHGPLASGGYSGTITFQAAYAGTTLTQVVNVDLSLTAPTLVLGAPALTIGGASGRDLKGQDLQLTLNTGTHAYAWTATPSKGWITLSSSNGTVAAAGSTLKVVPDPSGLSGGTYQGQVDFHAVVNGDTLVATLPVTLNLDAHRLLASDAGAAFASTPTLSSLTRTLQVRDNFGLTTSWTATSDQAWLTVTPSGTTADGLVLTANPAALAPDTIQYATVTLGTPDTTIQGAETIKVGFWVGSLDPAASTVINLPIQGVVADPIRPYAYAHSGGSDLTIYNVYTCAVVGTIPSVAAQLGDMTVSQDGSTLYVTDNTNFQIVPVNLQTRTVGTPWAIGMAIPAFIHYARTNGKDLIIAGNRGIFDAKTGALLGGNPIGSGYNYGVSTSLIGDHVAIDSTVYTLDYTAMNGGQALLGPMQAPNAGGSNGQDFAFSNDGTRFYLATGSPYNFPVVSTATTDPSLPLIQTLPGSPYPDNVEVARDGRIFCGITTYGPPDVWVYAPNGTELARYQIAYYGLLARQLKVSGDGLRMIAICNDATLTGAMLTFTTVAP